MLLENPINKMQIPSAYNNVKYEVKLPWTQSYPGFA